MNQIVAHRGWSSKAPENTMASINLALEEEKIDMIEIDVQLTKDNVLVVVHDFVLERTSNGKGYIDDYTLAELRQLDFGSWFSSVFKGEKIPTLKEVLEKVNGKKGVIIEIKRCMDKYPYIAKEICNLLNTYKYKDKVLIKSFDHQVIKEVTQIDNTLKVGLLIYGKLTLLMEQIKYTGASFLSINYHYIDEKLVKESYANNVQLFAWTVNEEVAIDRIKKLDRNIYIITDIPQKLI